LKTTEVLYLENKVEMKAWYQATVSASYFGLHWCMYLSDIFCMQVQDIFWMTAGETYRGFEELAMKAME
jgi:hypothetical protein